VEAEVRQRAIRILEQRDSQLLTFKLDHDYGWDDGLICGGTMDIYVQTFADACSIEPLREAVDAIRAGREATIRIDYETDGRPITYTETIVPNPKLLIVGAGHVGQALAAHAPGLGFEVTVLDDREDCASPQRFPSARRLVADIETTLRQYPVDAQTYVVIVTRGHRHDGRALAAVIDSPARYIGLIGSRRKVLTIFEDLLAGGTSLERLLRVHAPIGLELGAVTVPEIAMSIAAELVAVRRGRDGEPARPMKFDAQKLAEQLEQNRATR
jgi:xanthine dehydrogenase accessory factor